MARKMCSYCTFRPAASNLLEGNICEPCYDYQGWENEHSDDDHENTGHVDGCLICEGAPDPEETKPETRKGHSNGIAKSHTSHAACSHPKTKSARAKCRKERAAQGE
jgi:hypothetical protein